MKQRISNPLFALLRPLHSPDEARQRLEVALAIHRLDVITALEPWFMHQINLVTDTIRLVSIVGSNFSLESNPQDYQYLLVGHWGSILVEHEAGSSILHSGRALLLPRSFWKLESEEGSSFTAIGFLPIQLLSVARSLASPACRPTINQETPLGSLLKLPASGDEYGAELLKAATSLTTAWANLGDSGEAFLRTPGPDLELYKIISLMVFTSLRNQEPCQTGELTSLDNDEDLEMEKFLDYITLNLDQPLSISQLHQQTTYSRRSLHYLFKKRLNCTPLQWIRRQRMSLALEKLKKSDPRVTSVSEIALTCGYKSLSRFYIDFRRTYGCKPYDILSLKDP